VLRRDVNSGGLTGIAAGNIIVLSGEDYVLNPMAVPERGRMKNTAKIILLAFALMAITSACQKSEETVTPEYYKWTWTAGSNTVNQGGTYGTMGTPSSSNVPGAREDALTWADSSDKLWLFGGYGYDSTGYPGRMNDLWKFDPATLAWTWVSGSKVRNHAGSYGTLGVAGPSNVPGARTGAVSWTGPNGDFWLFGGLALDGTGSIGQTNDLWKFDPTTLEWTWVSGSSLRYQPGVYGTLGVAGPSNVPGARVGAVSSIDASGNLWLFGGIGYDAAGGKGWLNDFWKFDPTAREWTWVSGSDANNQIGVYGTLGTPEAANIPGGRQETLAWIDASGLFWLFGGDGFDYAGNRLKLNDLWKFDPATLEWTWIAGGKTGGTSGSYGTQGTGDSTNIPGARYGGTSWVDSAGIVWIFGGYGLDTAGSEGWLNDLWSFNSGNLTWAWQSGNSYHGAYGFYGTLGTADMANVPGARYFPASWIDSRDVRWIFGGYGLDSAGAGGRLNDLWR
jgi:N-acetylneuraminic acid mutarotase